MLKRDSRYDILFDQVAVRKKWNPEFIVHLESLSENLFKINEFVEENIEKVFHDYLQKNNLLF